MSTPDDHFTAGPDCRVTGFGQWARWSCWWLSNYPCWDRISRRCSKGRRRQFRPKRSFCCRSRLPCDRFGQWARWWCWWLSNYPCWDCIFRQCSKGHRRQIHPRRSFHCRSRLPCDRFGQWARWSCWWLSNYPCWDCISRQCSKSCVPSYPPQTIISLPVQTAVCSSRAVGALVVLVAVQLSVLGLYLPPVLK